MTASTCSRSRPSNHSIMSSTLAPAFRFSKMTETGMRVPLSTPRRLPFPGCFPPQGIVTNPALPRKNSPFEHSIPFRGSVRISVCSEQREMGHEGRGGGGGQDQGTSSLVKNRSAEGPTLSKTKDERVGTRESSRESICAQAAPIMRLTRSCLRWAEFLWTENGALSAAKHFRFLL